MFFPVSRRNSACQIGAVPAKHEVPCGFPTTMNSRAFYCEEDSEAIHKPLNAPSLGNGSTGAPITPCLHFSFTHHSPASSNGML